MQGMKLFLFVKKCQFVAASLYQHACCRNVQIQTTVTIQAASFLLLGKEPRVPEKGSYCVTRKSANFIKQTLTNSSLFRPKFGKCHIFFHFLCLKKSLCQFVLVIHVFIL